jgi:hypothetical protein
MGKIKIGGGAAQNSIKTESFSQNNKEIVIKEVERIVEVPVEKIVEKEIIKKIPVEKIVEKKVKEIVYVDKPFPVVKEVERVVEVSVEVIKEVPIEVTVEKIVSIPVEVIKEVQIIKPVVPKWAMMIAAVELAIIILLLMSRS